MSHASNPSNLSHTLNFGYRNPEQPDGAETIPVEIRYRPAEDDFLLVGLPVVQWLDEQVRLDLAVTVGQRAERTAQLDLLTSRQGKDKVGVRIPLRDMRQLLGIPHRRRNRTPGCIILARLVRLSRALTFTVHRIHCLDYPPALF